MYALRKEALCKYKDFCGILEQNTGICSKTDSNRPLRERIAGFCSRRDKMRFLDFARNDMRGARNDSSGCRRSETGNSVRRYSAAAR